MALPLAFLEHSHMAHYFAEIPSLESQNANIVIVMEALGRMISTAVSGGLWSGFFVVARTDISHLMFVDDTLLFCGIDPNHLCNLRSFLMF
jgi:hypothetical protein